MDMGMSVSLQIWQQFVDLVFQDDIIKCKQNFDVILDDTKISPHKCQFFKKKIVYIGLEFQVQNSKVCYTPLKDECDAIRNLDSPKTLKQTHAFCGKVNFLSSFLPNLQ